MIVDVLQRLTTGVRKAVDDGYYARYAERGPATTRAPSLLDAVVRDAPAAFLAEVKPASPSAGDLSGGDPLGKAQAMTDLYARYGVSGISILTERETFQGSLELLAAAVRTDAHATPVLMKDFLVADAQLDAAAAAGASAVLLIHHLFARGDTDRDLDATIEAAHARGLEVLLEVDNGPAFEHAAQTKADLIGINNRDLRTLEMDKDRAIDVLRHRMHLVPNTPVLALSGVETRTDVIAMRDGGATGVLVGTSLMAAPEPRAQLRALRDLVHVKLCGAGHPDDDPQVRAALAGADSVGVVVDAGGSTRERTPEQAQATFAALPNDIERIIVTTATDPVRLDELVTAAGATGVQVHAEIDAATCAALRTALGTGTTIIALLRVPDAAASPTSDSEATNLDERGTTQALVATGRTLLESADRLLLDAVPPPEADPGGTGHRVALDRAAHIIAALRPGRVVLAGGLDPENVATAVRRARPWGVDVSSGTEAPGVKGRKDPGRLDAFLRAARSIHNVSDAPQRPDLKII